MVPGNLTANEAPEDTPNMYMGFLLMPALAAQYLTS